MPLPPRSTLFPYTTLFRSISCLIWLDLVASLPLIKERILVIILLLHFLYQDRKSGSAGMPRPISYAVFCLKKKNKQAEGNVIGQCQGERRSSGVLRYGRHR